MSYQTPVTIAHMLRELQAKRFVLPDIQREFVWSEDQIAELFDSLMRGYPIGTFLFWKLEPDVAADYQFYEFITDYSELSPHNPQVMNPGLPITAVLDGQQRLSALNIGLRGSYATRLRYGRRNDPVAYPRRFLHLNVLNVNNDGAPDESMYEFAFLTKQHALDTSKAGEKFWIPVNLAYDFEPSGLDWSDYLDSQGLAGNRTARTTFHRLMTLVHNEPVLVAFDETGDDVDKVLNIFIRVNRGGTKLSYSDLLMSMASATWSERDARREVHDLVDTLNAIGDGFELSRDRILKASLVLCDDIADIKLKTRAMKDHMLTVEDAWDDISQALEVTMQLLANFGLSAESLRAGNAIIPVAYYIRHRGLSSAWLNSTKPADISDRAAIRSWVIRGLLRSGFWTGAVDPILLEARRTIQDHGQSRFPATELEINIENRTSKSLKFTADQLDELLATTYRSPLVGPLLQLMLDRAAERDATHVDHVYPKTLLKKRAMTKALVASKRSGTELEEWLERVDQIANLQLLRTGENTSKGGRLPGEWLATLPAPTRDMIVIGNDIVSAPNSVAEWFEWFEERRNRMRGVLASQLGVSTDSDDELG